MTETKRTLKDEAARITRAVKRKKVPRNDKKPKSSARDRKKLKAAQKATAKFIEKITDNAPLLIKKASRKAAGFAKIGELDDLEAELIKLNTSFPYFDHKRLISQAYRDIYQWAKAEGLSFWSIDGDRWIKDGKTWSEEECEWSDWSIGKGGSCLWLYPEHTKDYGDYLYVGWTSEYEVPSQKWWRDQLKREKLTNIRRCQRQDKSLKRQVAAQKEADAKYDKEIALWRAGKLSYTLVSERPYYYSGRN